MCAFGAFLALLLGVGQAAAPPWGWAQRVPFDGIYDLASVQRSTDAPGEWKDDPDQKRRTPQLFFLTEYREGKRQKDVYVWGDSQGGRQPEYSEYTMVSPNTIRLCASRWRGELASVAGGRGYRLTVFSPVTSAGIQFRYILDMKGGVVGNPLPAGPPTPCESAQRTVPRGATARVASVPPLLALQAPAAAPRRVNGQLLLTVKNQKDAPASEDDKRLWSCLVTKGFPGVRFDPVGSDGHATPGEEAFVWPDGHFQAVFQPATRYAWTLTPVPDCAVRPPEGTGEFLVPRAEAQTEEKIVVGCFIAGGRFSGCDSWWLARP